MPPFTHPKNEYEFRNGYIEGKSALKPKFYIAKFHFASSPRLENGKIQGSRIQVTIKKDLHEMLCQKRHKGHKMQKVRVQEPQGQGKGEQRRIGHFKDSRDYNTH